MDWPTVREIKKLLKAGKIVSQRSKTVDIQWPIYDVMKRNGQLLVKDCQHHWYGTEGTKMVVKEN